MKAFFALIAAVMLIIWIGGVACVNGFEKAAELMYPTHSEVLSEAFGVGVLVLGFFAMLTVIILLKVLPAAWARIYIASLLPIVSLISFFVVIFRNFGGDVLSNPFPPAFLSLASIGFYMPCMAAGILFGLAFFLKISERN